MNMTEGMVLCSIEDYVATVTLNRPEVQNTLNTEMIRQLVSTLRGLDDDDDVRVIVITGAGRAFCAGVDLKEGEDLPVHEVMRRRKKGPGAIHDVFLEIGKPTAAAINGVAFGGGMEIALSCDLRFAADIARMGLLEVRWCMVPSAGGLQRLARIVGVGRAKQMAMSGDIIDALTAERIGLVQEVLPADDLMSAVLRAAARIAENSPVAVAQIKRCLDVGSDLWTAMQFDREVSNICFYLEDHAEAERAFKAKRKPEYKGR